MVKDQRIHELLPKAKLPTCTEGRKRKEITTLMFNDGELPTFTEGREKKSSTFTDDELPTFTEGGEKIYHNIAVHRR